MKENTSAFTMNKRWLIDAVSNRFLMCCNSTQVIERDKSIIDLWEWKKRDFSILK